MKSKTDHDIVAEMSTRALVGFAAAVVAVAIIYLVFFK